MGIVHVNYGDACGEARRVLRLTIDRQRARPSAHGGTHYEAIIEEALHAMHSMPPWVLRTIADRIDNCLPET
jgi:hypothetical protein